MTQSFRLDDLEEMWRLDSAPEPQPQNLSWFSSAPPRWEISEKLELSPGLWIVKVKKWLPISILDTNADLPVILMQPAGKSLSMPGWHEQALCAGRDTALYFGDDEVGPDIVVQVHPSALRQTKRSCAPCPVRRDCLTWALAHDESYGVWGGTSGRERKLLQELIRNGTTTIATIVDRAMVPLS